jgi:peptidoglycan/LPS O-acetylase OafA/YrhL
VKRDRILELDFIRSLAVLLLLIHHSGVYQFQIGSFPLSALSIYVNHLLLGAFVFISGFLIATTLSRREMIRLSDFYRSRLVRLYLPYLVALFLFVFYLGIRVSSGEFIIHIMGLQVFLSPKFSEPILTLWFISMLVIFLSIAPILIVSLKKIAHLFTAYLITYLLLVFIHNNFDLVDIRFIYFFPTFAIGSLIGVAKCLPAMKTSNWLLVGSLVGFCIGTFMLSLSDLTYIPDLDLIHVLWTMIYILSSIFLVLRVAQWLLSNRFAQKLSLFMATGSYFTYLYHRPIWKLLNDIPGSHGDEIEVLINLVSIPVVLCLAFLLQNLYGMLLVRR